MYKGINEFKKGYQPRAYVIKKHDGTIVAAYTVHKTIVKYEFYYKPLINA